MVEENIEEDEEEEEEEEESDLTVQFAVINIYFSSLFSFFFFDFFHIHHMIFVNSLQKKNEQT